MPLTSRHFDGQIVHARMRAVLDGEVERERAVAAVGQWHWTVGNRLPVGGGERNGYWA